MPTVIWRGRSDLFTAGVNTTLLEAPDSPIEVHADRLSVTRTYRGLHSLCKSSALARGTIGTGDMAGFIVSKSTVRRLPKQVGELVIDWESVGDILPDDTASLSSQDLNPSTEKNPAFAAAVADPRILEKVRAAGYPADEITSRQAYEDLAAGVGTAWEQGLDLAKLLRKGVQNYYQSSFLYTWVSHWAEEPDTVLAGGFIEEPYGPLEDIIASLGLSCLRRADSLQYDNGIYVLTRTWLCGKNGEWDAQLYPDYT